MQLLYDSAITDNNRYDQFKLLIQVVPNIIKGVLLDNTILFALTILVTYLSGIFLFSPLLSKLRAHGYVGRDMYKVGNPEVPEMGGIGICFAFLMGMLFISIIIDIPYVVYLVTFVLMLYFLFGLIDDLLGSGKEDASPRKIVKMIIPFFFAYPLANHVSTSIELPYIGGVDLRIFYPLIVLPLFVMVCANLTNMFSYYNGQSAGSTLIVLVFVVLKLYSHGEHELLFILFPFIGACMAFLSYNIHPAGVFPGDSGDMMMGAMIGLCATLGNIELFVFVALLPLIVNFVMVAWWFIFDKKSDKIKFGGVRPDNTIKPPNNRTLMWFFPYYIKLTENQTTLIMYALVLASSTTAWIIL